MIKMSVLLFLEYYMLMVFILLWYVIKRIATQHIINDDDFFRTFSKLYKRETVQVVYI